MDVKETVACGILKSSNLRPQGKIELVKEVSFKGRYRCLDQIVRETCTERISLRV